MRLNFPSLPHLFQRNSRGRGARDGEIRKWPLETMTQKITRWLIRRPFLVAHTGAEERIQDTFTGAKSLLPSLTQSVSSTGGEKKHHLHARWGFLKAVCQADVSSRETSSPRYLLWVILPLFSPSSPSVSMFKNCREMSEEANLMSTKRPLYFFIHIVIVEFFSLANFKGKLFQDFATIN